MRTVTHLAIKYLETAADIKRRLKWAGLALREDKGDSEIVKQMADSALIDHIRKLDTIIAGVEASKKPNKKMNPSDNPTPPKLPSLRDYTGLLRERRLALMDLARIRGVLDGIGKVGKGGNAPINIILPNINHGMGTSTVMAEQGGKMQKAKIIDNNA